MTTRRCFIGPIPEAWLSKHRKSWYKYRPHLSTYSSKTATFNAGVDVENRRDLTGLDGASSSAHFRGSSFPQPDDVDDAEEDGQNGTSNDGLATAIEPVPVPQEPGKAKQVNFGITDDRPKRKRQKGEPSMISRFTGASNKTRKSSVQSEGGESFVTARETPSSSPQNNRPGNASNSTSSLLQHGQCETGSPASPSTTPESPLRVQSGATEVGRTEAQEQSQQEPSNGSKSLPQEFDPAGDQAAVGLRRINPVSTGIVRFDIPEQPETPNVRIDGANSHHSLRDLLKPKPEPGQLIKAERMLVRVDWTKQELPAGYSENDSLKAESKAVEKWREFIVVCRRSTEDMDGEHVLQMTKTRVITARDSDHARKSVAHEVPLNKNKTKISMFSSLDKTIVLWTPWKTGTRTYILRPSSSASSVEWFTFLNTTLGWKRANSLTIHVPDLNVTLNLSNPFLALESAQQRALQGGNDTQQSLTSLAEGVVARDIIDRCIDLLKDSPVADVLDTWFRHDVKIGLAWKRYDRLEWVHGANESRMYGSIAMQQSYDLELRPKQHYPTQAVSTKKDRKTREEPPPVEGFLVRLTSQKGRHSRLGKTFFKRLYFSTHNQFLCFCLPSKAMPPKPPKMPKGPKNSVPKAAELAAKVPLIYAVNPFPIVGSKIEWLGGDTAPSTKKEMDQYAYEESERKIKNLQDTQGYIDITHIIRIRKMKQSSPTKAPSDNGEDSGHDSAEEFSDEGRIYGIRTFYGKQQSANFDLDEESAAAQRVDVDRTFEITLRNGLIVRLQAYDKSARKEWVKRLRHLMRYWNMRVAEDVELYKLVRHQNLKKLDIDEEMESVLGQFAQKWEVSKSFASSELFNICGISCCRAITVRMILCH